GSVKSCPRAAGQVNTNPTRTVPRTDVTRIATSHEQRTAGSPVIRRPDFAAFYSSDIAPGEFNRNNGYSVRIGIIGKAGCAGNPGRRSARTECKRTGPCRQRGLRIAKSLQELGQAQLAGVGDQFKLHGQGGQDML